MKKGTTKFISKLLHKGCATTLAVVLLPHPWVTTVSAAEQNSWVGAGMQAIQTVGGAIQGAMMQSQMMTPIDLSASMIKNVPAANLPAPLNKCLIPQAKIAVPRYCDAPGNPAEYTSVPDLSMSQSYRGFAQTKEFAEKQVLDLERMLDMGKNEFSNGAITGVQCLEDSLKKEQTRRQGIVNAIQSRIDQVKKRNEQFKEQVKLVELQMGKINGELLGSAAGSQHVADRLNPPIKSLPPACQAIIEKSQAGASSMEAGLYQLRDAALKPAAREGGEFMANQQIYKNDVSRFISEAQAYVAKHGIDAFRQNGLPSFKGNAELLKRITTSLAPFSARVEQEESKIREELKKVGYEAPDLDKNFSSDFSAFKADSKEFFRKKYISECVTGADNGLTIDPETILNALRQESTNNQGTTIITYKAALKNILETDSFVEDKIEQLKALDKRYGAGTVTLTMANANAKLETMPPYMYFQNAVAACENEYNDDKTFSSKDSDRGRSQAKKIERAEAYLNDLKNLHDTFVADMTREVTDDILNCNGRATEAGSCSLDGSFNITSDSFCFKSAESCASQINNCFNVADQLVQKKTTELNAEADKYNALVEGLFNDQQRFFAEFKSSVMQEAGLLNALVPGADVKFPADLFVSMPELELDPKTNTYMRGKSSKDIGSKLDAMALNMGKLKKMLEDQGRLADNEMKNYIKEQRDNIKENKDAFQELIGKCSREIAAAEGFVAEFNQKRSQDEQNARSAAGDFCRRFYDLSTNPNAACGDVEELYESANKAMSFVDSNARAYANDLRNLCNATQSEREEGTEDGKKGSDAIKAEVAMACADGDSWFEATKPYFEQFISSLPSGSDRDKIADFLGAHEDAAESYDALVESLSDDIKDDSEILRSIRKLQGVRDQVGDTRSQIEEDLMSNIKFDRSIESKTLSTQGEAKTALDRFKSATNLEDKLAAYNTLNNLAKQATPADDAQGASAQAIRDAKSLLGSAGDANYDHSKALTQAKQVKKAIDMLPNAPRSENSDEEAPYDGCGKLVAEAVQSALSECLTDSSSSCVENEFEDIIEDGNVGPARKIASVGLAPAAQAGIAEAFSSLGETDGMACDSLASNRRNSITDVEALDRSILGDDYGSLMNVRR